ncbi:MAG: tail fiber domain-containing protein, partial [Terriglobia bacterium]
GVAVGTASSPQPGAPCSSVTSDGTATANSIVMFTTNCNLEASAITQTGGNIGISGASPAGTKFQITDTPAADFGIHYTNHELLNSSVTKNGTNKGLTFVMDLSNTTIPAGVTDSGYRVGVEGAGYANTTGFAGTLGAQYGVWGRAGLAGATSGATVTNAYAGYFDIFNAVAGTTISNAYGVFIQNSATTGTIANRYDLYASSANGKSYFAGNVGIGTTTPTAKLEVNGTAKFDSGVTVTGLAAGNCVQAGTGGLLTTAASPCGGGGTITGVAAGTDLTGGGTSGMVTLKLDTTRVPELGTPNTFAGTQTVGSGDVSVSQGNLDLANTTSATTGVINLGGTAFIHDCCPNSTENAFVGINAGNFTANAASSNGGLGQNTAIGYQALEALTTGYLNAANGDQALSANTTGSYNVATGASALQANTTGNENTASGAAALAANSTGSGNTALGYSAGVNGAQTLPKTGSNSTFVGANATATVDNLTNATAIGYNAQVGESNALVLGNGAMVGIGTSTPQYALDVQGTGNFTAAVTVAGLTAGNCVQAGVGGLLTTTASACGSGGTITGVTAGTDLTGGGTSSMLTLNVDITKVPQLATANTFAGTQTISSGNLALPDTNGAGTAGVLTIDGNPFLHDCCGAGNNNVFLGPAGNFTTTGSGNTASGAFVLHSNTTGTGNTASGSQALYSNTTGGPNTASGYQALYSNTTGNYNTASGYQALYSNTTPISPGDSSYNTASGSLALYSNTTGHYNTASGYRALVSNTAGSLNEAYGLFALFANTTGNYNTAIGVQALLTNTTGSSNSALGVDADVGSENLVDATAIGAYAKVYASNALVLGSTVIQNASGNTNVGIDVGNPSNIFTVLQGGGHAISDGWDVYSSRRWKSDIQPLRGALGKVELLRGVSYTYTANGKHDIGMIAEEVGKVVPEVVSYEENGKDARGIDYARLTALLVEAVKQQQSEIQQEKLQIRRLEAKVRRLEASKADAVHSLAKPSKTAAAKAGK